MKIIEMTATFGCLDHAVLRPGEGFTLIMANNESGKSTWAAFLRAMLYGFPQRDRDRAGYLAEKNRYQPWSGAAMEGSLTLEWDFTHDSQETGSFTLSLDDLAPAEP